MDALARPTVFSITQAAEIRHDVQRAINELKRIDAAYENPFICQNVQGEHYAAKDLLEVSCKAQEFHNALQLEILKHVSGHLGPTVSSFDLGDIPGSENECVADIRQEYIDRLEESPIAKREAA